jgi:hypothetical protein
LLQVDIEFEESGCTEGCAAEKAYKVSITAIGSKNMLCCRQAAMAQAACQPGALNSTAALLLSISALLHHHPAHRPLAILQV